MSSPSRQYFAGIPPSCARLPTWVLRHACSYELGHRQAGLSSDPYNMLSLASLALNAHIVSGPVGGVLSGLLPCCSRMLWRRCALGSLGLAPGGVWICARPLGLRRVEKARAQMPRHACDLSRVASLWHSGQEVAVALVRRHMVRPLSCPVKTGPLSK